MNLKLIQNSFANLLLAVLACLSIACGQAMASAPRPNIVLFLIDDMNTDHIGCFGGDKKLTPNIDRMAAEGIRFASAHVSTTVCTPSRYSFMTGRYAGRSHSKAYAEVISGNRQAQLGFNMALESDNTHVGATLQKAGYTTGFVGKVHLFSPEDKPDLYRKGIGPIEPGKRGHDLKPGAEADRVFQHNQVWAQNYMRSLGFDFAENLYEGNLSHPYNVHNPEWTMDAALEFLDARKSEAGKPFYLQYCPTLTHGGGRQFARALEQHDFTGAGQEVPTERMTKQRERFQAWLKAENIRDSDAVGITWVDFQVGLILEKLRELGLDQNTLVIFTPDHGRDSKSALYTFNGTQVPLVMRWPQGIQSGQVCEAFVQNIDMAPTFYELAGAQVPDNYSMDGRSLAPLLRGETPVDWRTDLYFEIGAARSIMTKDWKYIALRHTREHVEEIKTCSFERLPAELSPTKRLGIGVRAVDQPGFYDEDQLYHRQADPKEQKNLAADPAQAANVKEMQERLMTYLKRVGTPFGEFIPGADTTKPGQVNEEIALAHRLDVSGHSVGVPPELLKEHPERAGKDRRKRKARKGKDENDND